MQTAQARALILNQPDLVPLLGDTPTGTTALSVSSKGAEVDMMRMGGPVWARLSGSMTETDDGSKDHYVRFSLGTHVAAGPDTTLAS
jgi:hypothetical protein